MSEQFILLFTFYCMIASPVDGYYNNLGSGWVPLSREKVWARFEAQRKQFGNNAWEEAPRDEAIKIVEPLNYGSFEVTNQTITQIDNEERRDEAVTARTENDYDNDKTIISERKNLSNIVNEDKMPEILTSPIAQGTLKRKTRKLLPGEVPNTDQLQPLNPNNNDKVETRKYEVTETNHIEYESKEGYFYEKPNTKTEPIVKGEKDNVLSDILLKYNIRVDDRLSNYAVSRLRPVRPPKIEQILLVPISLKVLAGNSRLLALLLSHYGQRGLNELYQKQAGKSFEPYKVYPDTDSNN